MSITIRTLADRDFFSWLGLYEGYAEVRNTQLTDERALRVWTWLTNPNHEENGLVAVDDDGALVGLVHYREFARPLENDRGIFIDDLFVSAHSREQGVGTALINAVRDVAAARGIHVVTWMLTSDNEAAERLYESVGTRTPWATYELSV